MALFNKDAKTKSLQDRLAERIQNSVQSSQAPYAPVTDKKDAAVANVTNTLKRTSTDPAAFTAALQGKVNPAKKGIDTKSVDSQTTQQAVTQEAGAQPTNRADNSFLDSYYSKRDETAGRTGTTVTPGSVKIDQSVFNDKSADSTVKNTLLSYYSKRQFENTPIEAAPISTVKPTRVDNTIIGTAKTYGGALGGGLTAINKFAADRLNDTSDNVKGVGITDYAVNYYKDKDDEWLRKNLNPATYKAVTNAMRTNADMRKQALDQRNATDALQLAGQENLRQAKEGTNKIGETAVNVSSNVMEMSADRAITAALTAVGVPAKISQYTPLYLRSLGASNLEARQDGATENQAFVYGNLAASLEVATETMLSPTNFAEAAYGKGWLGSGIGKSALSTFSRKVAKSPIGQSLIYAAGNLGLAGIEESGEEAVSGVLTPLIKRITYDKDAKLDPKEVGESMLTAFLATVLTGGAGVANTSRTASVYNNQTTVNSLIEIAKTTQDEKSKATKMATKLEKVIQDGGKPNNLEVVDLIHYLNESGSEAQTNKLYELADVDKSDSNAKAQLNGAVTLAMMDANMVVNNASNASESIKRNFDNNVNILTNALVSEDVSDALKPTIAYTLQAVNTTRMASNESGPVGIRRGDTVSYHVSQGVNETAPAGIEGYDVVRKHDNGTVDYIWTDDFNGNAFPEITRQVTVDARGKQTDTTPKTATIINDKSTLVPQNYTGFNVEEQRANENYWKEGRKRTGLSYNTTQMNNKAYFNNYWQMLQNAEANIANAQGQEVNVNEGVEAGAESSNPDQGRVDVVPTVEPGGRVREETRADVGINFINGIKQRFGANGETAERLNRVEKIYNSLAKNNVKPVDAGQFAGEIGGVAGTYVVPVKGTSARSLSSLTKKLKAAGFENIKYFAGDLIVADGNGNIFPVNGAFDGSTVYVCVDNLYLTAEQIADHETFHKIIKDMGEGFFNSVEAQMRQRDSAAVDTLLARYREKYDNPAMTDRALMEEIVCDAYGGMNIFQEGPGAEQFSDIVRAQGEAAIKGEETETSQGVENTEVAEIPKTEQGEQTAPEITTEDVNPVETQEEITAENVNAQEAESTEPIRINPSRGEWRDVSKEDAIKYGREMYKNLGNISDDSKRLANVNKTIQGYQLTPEDVSDIKSVSKDANTKGKVDKATNKAIEKAASTDANHEIWDEPNAKKDFGGKEENPDLYQFEVVEELPNGTVRHTFFDTEDEATAHADKRNKRNKTGAAIVVDLQQNGALEHALDESSRANMEAFGEEDERRAPKYSRELSEKDQKTLGGVGVAINEDAGVAYPDDIRFSQETWNESQYVKNTVEAAKTLAKNIGVTEERALKFINDINSIAAKIVEDRTRLDYDSAEGMSSFMSNAEYGATIDFSTICAKRRLFSGTFEAIQKALPNTVLTDEDVLNIRKAMLNEGDQVPCVMCYVEGSRAKMGIYAKGFIEQFKQKFPNAKWIPNMYDVNTPTGAEAMRLEHPDVYAAYNYFWNHYGNLSKYDPNAEDGHNDKLPKRWDNLFPSQGKPKMFQSATAYNQEVLEKYDATVGTKLQREKKRKKVNSINLNAGLRLQSFSDFEVIHLIDAMQVIMDMSNVGLAGHAYTKVPEFAKALGTTGLKINLSLVAKGIDENGNIIFDDVEGMPWETAKELRDQYPDNVGTILVTFNNEQLKAAMADDRVDFIIPFHRSQWSKKQFESMGMPKDVDDATPWQNESWIDKTKHYKYKKDGSIALDKSGKPVVETIDNIPQMAYWDFSKPGKWNAEHYLEICANGGTFDFNGETVEIEGGRVPMFSNLLVNNGDGSYSLQPDGSTDGYWKLIIDFKMYNHQTGEGAPFNPVKPEFNMVEAEKMLDEYEGGHQTLPVDEKFAKNYIKDYKKDHPSVKYSRSFDSAGRNLTEGQEEYFKDSKIRDEKGNLMPVYHGTDADFNIFDLKSKGGKNGTAEGFGIYLTNDEEVSKSYGSRTIEGYANITKPAKSFEKTIKRNELARLIQKTCEIEAQNMVNEDGYDNIQGALKDTWVSNYTDTYQAKNMDQVYRDVADSIIAMNDSDMDIIQEVMVGQGIRDYEDATDFYENALTPVTGIDGFWTKWSDAEGNETADVMLAFSSNQVKNLDNLTPTTNPDIRFSRAMDSNLRTLSDEQAEFFKDSKVRDRFGNLLALRHGTASDFTVFDPSRSGNNYNGFSEFGPGIYLTPDVGMAKFYADKATKISNGESKIMDLYANITNPFDVIKPIEFSIDDIAEKYNLHDYDVAEMTRWGDKLLKFLIDKGEDTRAYLSGKGYDGIIVSWYENTPSQVIAFNPNQVKNIDNLTPTTNEDIRFSRSFASTEEMDRAYNEAVKSNPEEAQKMLDAYAEEKGYTPYALYHGTDNYGFTEFDLGRMDDGRSIFMTDEKEVAKSYSNSEYVGTPKPLVTDDLRGLVDEYIAQNPRDKVTVISPDGLEKEYARIIDNAHKEIAKNKKSFENDVERYGWAEDDNDRLEAISAAYEKGLNAETREELDEARDDFMDVFGDFVPEYFDISNHLSQLSDVDVAMEYGEPVAYIKYDGYGYGEYMTADDLLQLLGSNDNASGNLKLYAKTDNPLVFDANLYGWDTMKFDPLGVEKKMGEIQTMAWKELGLAIDPKEINNLYKTGEISDGIEAAMQNDSIKQLVNEVGDASVEYQRYNIDPFNHTTRTREVSAYAKGNGYDSVIFKNLYDIGRYGGTHRYSTIYILFNPSQAKSADLVTYYGDGTSIPLSQRFDANQTDIRFSRNFETPTTITARAENEYTKNMVSNFNSSTESRNRIASLNPTEVAQTISTHYNSSIDKGQLKSAVDQLKQYANAKISTGQDVNYADVRIIASTIARQVVAQNKALTDTDGYKTYAKMLKIVDEMPVKIPGNISRYIENYQGWKTANIDNIRIEQNGVPVKAVYDRLNKAFGDELFPTNLKQYEMAERIAEVVGNYRNIYENPYNDNLDLATQFATNDILNMVFKSPNTIDIGDVDLTKVYDTINDRRAKMLEKIGQAYSKGEDIDVTTTEEFRKAQTIETETDDGVDYRHANLNPEEWKTTKTKGNKAKGVLSPTDIIAKMEHDFGHNITEGQIRKKDVLGTFNRNNKGIRIKFSNDLPTACHELGHALDLKYNIQSKLTESMKNELLTRHRKGVQALIASYPESKRLGEAIAEYNREFLQNRDNVLNRFPEFSKFYLNSMSEDDRANMFALADNINAYYVASAKTAQPSVRLRSEGQPDYRTFGEKLKDKCKHLYQMFVDSNAAINDFSKATGSNAYILATNAAYADARAGQIIVGALFDKDGTMVSEGLTAALNEINLNDDVEYKAFGEYLIVKHGPEFMETTGGDVFVNPIQNTAEWMNKRAAELEEKYPAFKESAEKLYNFQNQFLYTWGVETGLISEEVYNEWTERWKYYVPFNRVIVRDSINGFVMGDQSRRGFANQTSGIHKAKGSTRDIYHPVDNIMMNIIKMVKAGMSNQVMVEIADAAVKNNVDANIMEKIPAPMVGKNFYTEALKKKLATQFEDANAMGQIADESLDAIEDIIDGIDAVITQYSVGKAVGDKVTLLRDGKEEFWKINDPFLLESLTKMQPNRAGGLLEAYAVMSRFMTSNITGNNIIWSLSRNAPKDLGTLYTYSPTKSPIKIFGGIAKAYSNNIKNAVGVEVDPYYMEYLAMGGGKTSAYTADINTADRARKQMRIKATQQKRHVPQLSSLIKSPIEMIELVSDTVELGPRFATYRALRNQGVEPQQAFYEACDVTVNFRRSGWMSRQINMVTPFFNANVQGIDKFVRFFTAANVPAGEKAKVLAGRATFFVAQSALMAAITIALNYRDKDKEKEYEQLSTFTKNNYWCIPADIANRFGLSLKNGEFLALPKARELGILSSFIERCWEDRMRTDDHAWDEFAQYTSDNLLPAYLAELADGAIDKNKSVFEAMEEWPTNLGVFGVLAYAHANKDFLGRNIVSESLLNYEKKDQFTGKTSIPAYYIGQAFNLSPQKIDFVGQQVFSNVWKPMQALFPKDDFYKDKTLGVRNAWIKDSQYSNDLVNWMYDQADASEKKKNSDKENAEKVYRYSMDNKMKTFYGNYYSLTKEMDETADSRLYRQKVLDMISDYQESVENGVPQSQRAVYEVFKKYNDTNLLPTVMGTTIKDGSGTEYELNYKQYFNYQGSYNNNYYNLANDVFSVLTSPDDRALALKKIKGSSGKGFAQLMAIDEALINMGKNPTGELDKYQDVDLRNVVIWQVYSTKADEAGVSVDDDGNVKNNGSIDQKEARYALDQMDWLTPHEKAVLWNSKWDTVKNNPWKEYL